MEPLYKGQIIVFVMERLSSSWRLSSSRRFQNYFRGTLLDVVLISEGLYRRFQCIGVYHCTISMDDFMLVIVDYCRLLT